MAHYLTTPSLLGRTTSALCPYLSPIPLPQHCSRAWAVAEKHHYLGKTLGTLQFIFILTTLEYQQKQKVEVVPPIPMEGFKKDGAVVQRQVESDNTQLAQWLVRCSCGAEFIKRGSDIRRGQYLRCRSCANRHIANLSMRHGESEGYLMHAWDNMLKRCYSENYERPENYAGRGITVHEPWRNSYSVFAADIRQIIGERPSKEHSLDRIDNDGNYAPGNVRWATRSEQMSNRRPSSQWKGKGGRPRKTASATQEPSLLQVYVDALLGAP